MALCLFPISGPGLYDHVATSRRCLQEMTGRAEIWNARVTEWVDLAESVSGCLFWQAHWLDLLSRVAKFDTQGVVPCANGLCLIFNRVGGLECACTQNVYDAVGCL